MGVRRMRTSGLMLVCASLMAGLVMAPAVVAADEARRSKPDIEAFASLPLLGNPKLSPDGTRYACIMSIQGDNYFMVMAVDESKDEPFKLEIGEKNELVDWEWVNDSWLLITVATSLRAEGEDFRVRRAYGVSAVDRKLVPIARDIAGQNGADILWIATDGTPRALIAVQQSIYSNQEKFYPEVFEVDVSTGRLSSRARPRQGVMSWYADSMGQVRMGIGYNDRNGTRSLLYRGKNGEQFRTIDRAETRDGEFLTVPALFLAQPGKAIAYSSRSGRDALYELDLATLELGKEVFSVPEYDVDHFLTDPTGTAILGVRYIDTRLRTEWLDPVMSKAQRDLDRAVGPDRRAHVVSMSRDQNRLLVLAESPSSPGAYYLTDLARRSMVLISERQPQLAGRKLAPVSSLRYRARDDLEIEAVLTLPNDREAKGLPLIVLPHGGPEARDDESWDWQAQYLAHLGYAVVQPNYRGSTGYGKALQDKGDGQWGLAMQDDLLDAIDHLAAAGTIDPKRVCIAGGSYGGYAALRGAQRDGSRYRCAISYAGVSDLNGMLRYDGSFLYGRTARDMWRMSAPDLRAVSPVNHPEEFQIPVLLMHGKEDLRVPVAQSRSMAEKLKQAGKQVHYIEQPLADHHFSRAADRLQYLQEITRFLLVHNPP